ncbi:hypothetical protein K439DRAFT_1615301 [Ramaria rubella]|nr:hypothetical protein K439DRAFT_1615301 [Ramaria rubella]
MSSRLPNKIWVQVSTKYISTNRDLHALSSTNKQLRELIVPFIFQCIDFRGFLPDPELQYDSDIESHLDSLIPYYARIHKRVNWLKRRHCLLSHVETIQIRGWSHLSAIVEEDPNMWYSPTYSDAMDRWTTAYDALIRLVATAPSLKILAVIGSPITSRLQSTFYLSPHLKSLVLSACEVRVGRSKIHRSQIVNRLQDLAYEPTRSTSEYIDSSFKQLLSRCLPSLVSLKIPMDCIGKLGTTLSAFAQSKPQSLRHLVISESPFGPVGVGKAAVVYDLLKSCPDLQTLKIMGWVDQDLPALAVYAPKKLDYISGTSTVFQALLPGRPIHSIHLQYCPLDPITPSSLILSRQSTAIVRKVYFDCGATPSSEVIASLGIAFRQLQHLTIRFLRGYTAKRSMAIEASVCRFPRVLKHPSFGNNGLQLGTMGSHRHDIR